MERIEIRAVERPDAKRPEMLIRWFCYAFGLSNTEEGTSVEEEILSSFVKAAFKDEGISSSELKLQEHLARSTVIYHINRFIDTGLVVKRGRKYYLRASEMSKAIEEIEYDIDREMNRMLDTAREFDRLMLAQGRRPKRQKRD